MPSGGLFPDKVMLLDCCPEVSAYYFKEWNGFDMPFHTHDSSEIMYVIDGKCSVGLLPSGEQEAVVRLAKGGFILLDGTVPHRLLVPDACRMLNIEFRFVEREGVLPAMRELAGREIALASLFRNPAPFVVFREFHDLHQLLKSLVIELDEAGTGLRLMPQLMLAQLLIRVARLHQELAEAGSDALSTYVRQCIEFLYQNYDRGIQVKDVAEHVRLHPGYLQRVFKQKTGFSIMEYLKDYRMEKTAMLLRQTEIPVADIADYVGIGSRQYLHMLFKKHTGRTPVEYRKASRIAGSFDEGKK